MRAESESTRAMAFRRSLSKASALSLLLFGASCATIPDTDGARGQAVDRPLDESHVNTIECKKNDCQDWHRVRLHERGTLSIHSRAVRSDTPNPRFATRLEDGFGEVIENLPNVGETLQSIVRELDPGAYLIGIQAPDGSKAIVYELTIRFDPASLSVPNPIREEIPIDEPVVAPVSPPEQTYRRVEAEVLEVEGKMAEPTAVLLDLGRNIGVRSGMRGELREGNSVVGEIEVIDIYDEGSRARVELPLRRPITPSVNAILFFPDIDEPDLPADDEEDSESPSSIWSTEPDAFQSNPH